MDFFFLVIMLLHLLLFGGYAFGYALFFGHICPKKAIMLLHMLLFGAYAIYYALILGSNMLSRGDCATAVLFKKNLNASKPSEHPPQVEECLKV